MIYVSDIFRTGPFSVECCMCVYAAVAAIYDVDTLSTLLSFFTPALKTYNTVNQKKSNMCKLSCFYTKQEDRNPFIIETLKKGNNEIL